MNDRSKIIWLSHGSKLIRASPEQLQPASASQQSEEAEFHPVDWIRG